MPTTAASLTGATDAQILAARNALITYLQERYPNLTIRGGPLADLVLGPEGDALAAIETRASQVEISYDPSVALAEGGYDEDILNSVLAGRGVARIPAAAATGFAGVRLTSSTTRSFPANFRFETVDGVQFVVSSAVRLLTPGQTTVLPGDYVLVADTDGTSFLGLVPISCSITGVTGNRPAGTSLTAVDTLNVLSEAWVAVSTTGGVDKETDAELLNRLPAATAPRTTASLAGAEGLVRDAIPAISYASAVKFGDAAMVRGRSTLSVQTPGRFDLRYRTASAPSRESTKVEATLIALDGDAGIWRFTLTRDMSPGRFLVERVLRTDQAINENGYTPTVVQGFDISDVDDPPDIRSVADAALSRYATATVTFTDPDTATDALIVGTSKMDYYVVCRLIPSVEDGQAAVDADDAKSAGGDCLVRTAVPCMVSVTAVATPALGVTITADQVASAVAQAINSLDFDSRLLASQVAAAAATILPRGTALLLSGWSGTIYPNDGQDPVSATADTLGLTVDDDFPRNISAATIAYCCDPESVEASVS